MARWDELQGVRRALDTHGGAGALIVGDRGVGKTRLAAEVARLYSERADVEWVTATRSATAVPLAAFVRLVPEFPGDSSLSEVLAGTLVGLRLRATAAGGMLLVVDDAHLLDGISASLLVQLAWCPEIRLIVNVRARVPLPDALTVLWKDRKLERIELQPLGSNDTISLLEAVLGGAVGSGTCARIWAMTKGNMLYVRELVEDLLRSGALHVEDDVWRWDGELSPGARLGDLVQDRIDRLTDAERGMVEMLAVAGPIESSVAIRLYGVETIGRLEQKRFVVVERDHRRDVVQLVHPLYGEVVCALLPTTHRAVVHGQLADAFDAVAHRRPGDLTRATLWALEAGRPLPAPLLIDAAREANVLAAPEKAERLSREALEADDTGRAALALGEALLHQGRYVEAGTVLRQLRDVGDTATRAQIAIALAFALNRTSGRAAESLSVLRGAEYTADDPIWREVLRADRVVLMAESGWTAEAIRLMAPLVDDAGTDAMTRLRALSAVGRTWALSGDATKAHRAACDLAEAAEHAHAVLPRARAWVFHTSSLALLSLGDLDGTDELVTRTRLRVAGTSEEVQATCDLVRARVLLLRGQPAAAAMLLQQVAAALVDRDTEGWRPWAFALLAEARGASGDVAGANAAAAAAERALPRRGRLFLADIGRANAWALAAAGELTRARATLLDIATRCRAKGLFVVEAHTLHDVVRFGGAAESAGRLDELRDLDGAWADVFADHATALLSNDGALLDDVADRFEAIGALRLAAEAAAAASRGHQRSGLRRRAIASQSRCSDLAARSDVGQIPHLSTDSFAASRLTRREHEIAGLAARGLTNREIADVLVVSVRTVEGHLYRMYAKLGVNDRLALADLI